MKRICSALTAACVLAGLSVGVAAADPPYSVQVTGSRVTFIQAGREVGSFPCVSTDLRVTTDTYGELLVQFQENSKTYSSITLGKQATLDIGGTMESLTVSSALQDDVQLNLLAESDVKQVSVYSPNDMVVRGKVTNLNINAGANVTVSSIAEVETARLAHAASRLKADGKVATLQKVADASVSGKGVASTGNLSGVRTSNSDKFAYSNSGLIVDKSTTTRSSTSSSSTSRQTITNRGSLQLRASTLDAYTGDTLEDLESDLEKAVRCYKGNTRIYGDVEWYDSYATKLRSSGLRSFIFTPDDDRYESINGRIRINLDDDDDDDDDYNSSSSKKRVELDISSFHVNEDDDLRLRDLESELEDNVRAYAYTSGDELEGTLRWSSSSKRVDETDYFSFTFTPDSSRYAKTTGRIKIYVD